jgi:2-oxoglutarate ferredoxin oxidoreductase subunit alpha
MAAEVVEWDGRGEGPVDLLLVSHGVVSRAALAAYETLTAQGLRVAYFRPITLRPFPTLALASIAKRSQQILVIESAYGQLLSMVRDALYGQTMVPIQGLLKPGVGITSEEVVNKSQQFLTERRDG